MSEYREYRVFTCNDHVGVYPTGTATVIVARSASQARRMLQKELLERRLDANAPFTLRELFLDKEQVRVLRDGNY